MERDSRWTGAFLALLAAGTGLRLAAINNDLWLDEIWSILFAEGSMERASDVLFSAKTRHSNNHPLNTLYIYLVGHHASPVVYRLLSLVSGIGSIVVLWLLARRRDHLEALLVAGLASTSFLLIQFSTEARGYAPMLLFAVSAYLALTRNKDAGGGWTGVVPFWVCAILGVLSHLSFVYFLVAAGVWSAVDPSGRDRLPNLTRLYAVPFLACTVLWAVFVRGMGALNPGDPETGTLGVVVRVCSLTMGGPSSGSTAALATAALAVTLVGGLVLARRDGPGAWVFYAVIVLVSPVLVIVQRERVYSRMFLLASIFFLLLYARVLASMLRRTGLPRAVAIALLALYLAGNMANASGLYRHGRGAYRDALRYMAENTPGALVSMTSDNDHRVGLVVAYHRQFVRDKRFDYVPEASAATPPPWYLRDRGELAASPEPLRFLGAEYEWVRTFRYAGVSGRHWLVYRLVSTQPE